MPWRNEGSALGEAAAELLLSHSQWIFRRVESVDFRDDGITRRRVSFDFQVPPRCLISWGPAGTESHAGDLIATPLSFMRKGLLVNLDVVDEAGSSVPIAGFGDNGALATAALEHLAKASGVIRAPEAQATSAQSVHTPADGIFCVVHSLLRRSPVWTVPRREGDRRGAFKATLDEDRKKRYDSYLNRLMCNGDAQAPPESVEESQSVAALNQAIEEAVGRLAKPTKETEEERRNLLALLLLLSTLAESFAFTALTPLASVHRRSIVKVGLDARTPPTSRFHLGKITIPLVFASYGAASTHISVRAAEGAALGVPVERIPTENKACPAPSASEKCESPCGTDCVPRADSLDARVVGGRVHLETNPFRLRPLTHVDVRLHLSRSRALLLFTWVSSLVLMSVLTMTQIWGAPGDGSRSNFLSPDNVIATVTVVVAIWAAVFLFGPRHKLAAELGKPLEWGALVAVVCGALLLIFAGLHYQTGSTLPTPLRTVSLIVAVILALTWIYALAVLVTVLEAHRSEPRGDVLIEEKVKIGNDIGAPEDSAEVGEYAVLMEHSLPCRKRIIEEAGNRTEPRHERAGI